MTLYFMIACWISVGFGLRTLSSPLPSAETSGSSSKSAVESARGISNSSSPLLTLLLANRPGVALNFAGRGSRLRPNPALSRHASYLNRRVPFASRTPWIRMAESDKHGFAPNYASNVGMDNETSNGITWSDRGNFETELQGDLTKKTKTRKPGVIHDEVMIRERLGRELPIAQIERYTSRDWIHILLNTPNSVVLKNIRGPILTNMVWASIVWGAFRLLKFPAKLFTQAHSLIGSALSLLLVFRTNAAYQRFSEGNKIWENLLGYARDLVRMSMMYDSVMPEGKAKRISNLICAFSTLLAEHLGYSDMENFRYERFLTQEDRTELKRYFNRPLWAVNTLAREVREIPELTLDGESSFSSRERLAMMALVNKMSQALGKCERLVQTPVPLNYARHTARALAMWCLTLPFALTGGLGLAIVPVMGFVSWLLYGIQEIGLTIEDPFRRSLRLDVSLQTIYADVIETIKMNDRWKPTS